MTNKRLHIESTNDELISGLAYQEHTEITMPDGINEICWIGNGLKIQAMMGVLEGLAAYEGLDHQFYHKKHTGTASGAVVALMCSMGMSLDDMKAAVDNLSPEILFDVPSFPREVPGLNGFKKESRNDFLYNEGLDSLSEILKRTIQASLPEYLKQNVKEFSSINTSITIMEELQYFFSNRLQGEHPGELTETLNKYWLLFFRNLYNDYGLFSGKTLRNYFDKLITEQSQTQFVNITFRQHASLFKSALNIPVFNMTLGQWVTCNAEETPDVPVADAIRMALGVPFLYKPLKIDEVHAGQLLDQLPQGWYTEKGSYPYQVRKDEFRIVLGCEQNNDPENLLEYMNLVMGKRSNDAFGAENMVEQLRNDDRVVFLANLHGGITDFIETENISRRLRDEAKKSLYLHFT